MTLPVNEPIKTEPVTPPTQDPQTGNQVDIMALDENTVRKIPAVQSLLESTRTEEKNKLYKTIETKDSTIKQLNDTITNLQTDLKTKEESSMEGEKELLAQIQAMKEAQDKLIKDMERKEEESRLAKLEAFKATKLAEAGEDIITDLVGGTTEEEISASIEKAKEQYRKIAEKFQAKKQADDEAEKARLEAERLQKEEEEKAKKKADLPKTTNPASTAVSILSSDEIRKLSPAEYAKYREDLLKSARQ
jgi:hypothetical protein